MNKRFLAVNLKTGLRVSSSIPNILEYELKRYNDQYPQLLPSPAVNPTTSDGTNQEPHHG